MLRLVHDAPQTALWVFDAGHNAALGILEWYSSLVVRLMYDAPGEIEFTAPLSALDDGGRLTPGLIVWPKGCEEAFIIESVTLSQRSGGASLTARGRTLTALLERRCMPDSAYYTGAAGYVVRRMTEDVFVDAARAFPAWSMLSADGLGENVSYMTSGESLLEAASSICAGSGLGMRTRFDPATCSMRLELYEGADRFDEHAADPATLDPAYDNLLGLTASDSVENYANVLYVLGETGGAGVAKKIAVDGRFESMGERTAGLDRFERSVRFTGTSVTDGSDSAIGRPPGGGGGASANLTDEQYAGVMKAYALNALRAMERGAVVSGAVEYAAGTLGSALALGDILRVRARRWGVDTVSRVRTLEERTENGVTARHAVMGAV